MEELVRRYLGTWNIRDASKRRSAIEAIFVAGCTYTDPHASVQGPSGVDGFIGAVQDRYAGITFELAGRVDAHHEVARFTWHALAPGVKEPVAIGFDVITLEGDRIKQVFGFLDKAPA